MAAAALAGVDRLHPAGGVAAPQLDPAVQRVGVELSLVADEGELAAVMRREVDLRVGHPHAVFVGGDERAVVGDVDFLGPAAQVLAPGRSAPKSVSTTSGIRSGQSNRLHSPHCQVVGHVAAEDRQPARARTPAAGTEPMHQFRMSRRVTALLDQQAADVLLQARASRGSSTARRGRPSRPRRRS